jgi:hypothetical protein
VSKILEHIADKTNGFAYKSHRFCYDAELNLPSLAYDENKFTIRGDKYGETAPEKKTKFLGDYAQKIQKEEEPLFSYFLDGSRRIYKVDDIEYQKRIFPIIGGQVGVACCQRKNADSFVKAIFEKHLVMSMPSMAISGEQHPTQFLGKLVQDINQIDRLKRSDVQFSEILTYKSDKGDGGKEEYLDRGTAKIQDKMIECEKKAVSELVKKNCLDQDHYLIKDGSLQYKPSGGDFKELSKFKANYRRVVGVSKSFNPELITDNRNKSNASAIANLSLYHRTPSYKYQTEIVGNVHFCIWYVRVREATYTDSPFSGVLKIEKLLVTDDEINYGLESKEIDRITANIINERNPVCYGKDQRWANHLYPIYLTESYIKSQYLSDLHFINLF